MSRKKKLINNTDIPQYAIERVARCVIDDIREDYLKEEIQKAFAEWQKEMLKARLARGKQEKRARAAETAALVFLCQLFLSWATGFRLGAYQNAIGEVGLVIPCEINNKSEPIPNGE